MYAVIRNFMQESMAKGLENCNIVVCNDEVDMWECELKWLFGSYVIEVLVNSLFDSAQFVTCRTTFGLYEYVSSNEGSIQLVVYPVDNQANKLLVLNESDIKLWSWLKLQNFILSHEKVTVAAVANAVEAGTAMYYKKSSSGYASCEREVAEWVSLQAGKVEQFLPMGYPLLFIENELASRRH